MSSAIALGERLQSAGKSDDLRIQQGFQLCTARTPTSEESKRLQALLQDERQAGVATRPWLGAWSRGCC